MNNAIEILRKINNKEDLDRRIKKLLDHIRLSIQNFDLLDNNHEGNHYAINDQNGEDDKPLGDFFNQGFNVE